MLIHVCRTPIYEFNGWIFEFGYQGAWPLTKDFEPRKRAGDRFYEVVSKFGKLTEKEQRAHRVGGGCMHL